MGPHCHDWILVSSCRDPGAWPRGYASIATGDAHSSLCCPRWNPNPIPSGCYSGISSARPKWLLRWLPTDVVRMRCSCGRQSATAEGSQGWAESDARGARASATLAPPGVMCTRGLFTQVGLGPGASWASAGPKCAEGSNAGRGLALAPWRGCSCPLEWWRLPLEIAAFSAARGRGFHTA